MTAHLRPSDIESIIEILDGWTGKLSWPALVERIEHQLHRRYTRLTLSKKPRIATCFAQAKGRSATQPKSSGKHLDPTNQIIERLKAEKARVEMENHKLLEQHLRWRYNAHLHGLSAETLNRPLPPITRSSAGS